MTPPETAPEQALGQDPPSKSQRKRDMLALQALGESLVTLSGEQLATIDLPEELRLAVNEARGIRQHGARKRQLQFIGKLMRRVDAEPIRAALDRLNGVSAAERARQHRLERLRERLLEDEAVLHEIGQRHPQADFTRLRQLRRATLQERETGKPPRSFRELFRLLREIEDEQ